MTSSAGSVCVSRCICRGVEFAELLPRALAAHWTLADLIRETGCGGQCGLCRPYLREMLLTGRTTFHDLLPPESLS
jgi:bacterioferritin-associated ferredoxin